MSFIAVITNLIPSLICALIGMLTGLWMGLFVLFMLGRLNRHATECSNLLDKLLLGCESEKNLPSQQEILEIKAKTRRMHLEYTILVFVGFPVTLLYLLWKLQKPDSMLELTMKILPEDLFGELEALRNRLIQENKHPLWIQLIILFCFLDMLKGCLQIQIENIWFAYKKRS